MPDSVLIRWTRLERWLSESGTSQMELAERMGVSPGLVSQWITGRTKPSFEMLTRLTGETGLSIDDLCAEFTTRRRA